MRRIYRKKFSCLPADALVLLFSLLLCPMWVQSQSTWSTTNCPQSRKEATRWYFGVKAGIDFLSDPPIPLVDQNVMSAIKPTSSICDSMGNFLFFTDGNKVWDRTMTLMDNATNLLGDQAVTQPSIIVPWPGDSSLYYLFTIDVIKVTDPTTYFTQGLYVTLIDMKERGGLGNALSTVLNKEVLQPVTQKLTAVKHRNGKDYWVIAHKWNSRDFYAWHISGTGMAPAVISTVGSNHGDNADVNNAVGYMKASPDGNKLALAILQQKVIELFDFNNETGEVTNPQTYTTKVPGINPYGIEFSPDSKKLYSTLFEYGGTGNPARPSYLIQFDISSGLGNPVTIDSLPGVRNTGIQLAPDGRIYIARTGGQFPNLRLDSLEVIYNPNRPGTFCNFNHLNGTNGAGFPLLGRKSVYSLPNFVQSFVNIPTFTWDSVCQGNATRFKITNRANCESVLWNFGDNTSSGDLEPVHTFTSPGKYWVKLTEYYQGNAFTDSMLVTNYKLPQISLADTVLLYTGSSINLHAGGGFMEYTWSTSSHDSIITVASEGDYWVRVKDNHCCINNDTTYVKVFAYSIPNAFTPNGDGLNDIFRVNGLYRNIDFSMVVFDRWGRQVFESKNIDTGWDGMFGGQFCEPDSYVWIVTIKFRGEDIITQGDVKFKGTVTLVQ